MQTYLYTNHFRQVPIIVHLNTRVKYISTYIYIYKATNLSKYYICMNMYN